MKKIIIVFYGLFPCLVQAQSTITNNTYHAPQGSYVAPVTTKTYTTPATVAPRTTYQSPASNSSSYSPANSGNNSNNNNNNYSSAADQGPEKMDKSDIVVVNPQLKHAPFSLARKYNSVLVKFDYGFVDSYHQMAIPFSYDDAREFSEGMAAVKSGNKWGFIDSTGAVILPMQYTAVSDFRESFATVTLNNKTGLVYETGALIMPIQYEYLSVPYFGASLVMIDGKFGVINVAGKILVPCIYERGYPIANYFVRLQLNGKWGYVEFTKNKVAIPFNYDDAGEFQEIHDAQGEYEVSLAAVVQNGKCGFIDEQGKVVIPFEYDVAIPLPQFIMSTAAPVSKNKKRGYVDVNGNFTKAFPKINITKTDKTVTD